MRDRQPLAPAPLRLRAALREYLREEAAGGIVLMAAAAVALAWANSPWRAAYAALWETRLAFQPGRFDAAVKLGCCSPRCSPAPAARWSCWRMGANGVLDALDDFCAFPYPPPLVEAGGVRAPTTRPPGQRPEAGATVCRVVTHGAARP